MITSHTNSRTAPHLFRMKQSFKLMLYLIISSSFCLTNSVFGQETDSLKTEKDKSIRSTWANKPPSGQSEKSQGGIIMALGASSVLTGILFLNTEDPCDDFSGSNVFCTSNVEAVRAVGAITVGAGVAVIIYGIVRFSDGAGKARAYNEWKRKNKFSFRPELRFDKDQVELGMTIGF